VRESGPTKEAARARLRLGHELLGAVQRDERHVERTRARDHLGPRAVAKCLRGEQPDHVGVAEPMERPIPLRLAERVHLQQLDEGPPLPWARGERADVAVGGREHAVRAVGIARRDRRQRGIAPRVVGGGDRPRMQAVDRGLLHRDVDRLSATVASAIEHRRERSQRGEQRAAVVREIARQPARWTIGEARREEPAGRGEGRQRFETPLGVRTREPEVGHHDVDEMRVALPNGRRVEPERGRALPRQVVEQHVGLGAQAREPRRGGRLVAVEHETTLVGVPIEKRKRPVRCGRPTRERTSHPPDVAAVELDLHDVGAEIAEDAGGERPTNVGAVDDAEMGERAGHRALVAGRPAAGKLVPDTAWR
jgi:hypothetical protein